MDDGAVFRVRVLLARFFCRYILAEDKDIIHFTESISEILNVRQNDHVG
jgi:hypothetical protein